MRSSTYPTNKALGDFGEQYVIALLRDCGIESRPSAQSDVQAGGITIEVKTSQRTILNPQRHQGYQFCLHRPGHHRPFSADYLVCLCADGGHVTDAYVIPAQAIDHKHKLVIPTDHYQGKWSQFHDAWEHILSDPRATRKAAS